MFPALHLSEFSHSIIVDSSSTLYLQRFSYPEEMAQQFQTYISKGFGDVAFKSHAYVQAARVNNVIHLAGQGGRGLSTEIDVND